jgi:hypothetical protein
LSASIIQSHWRASRSREQTKLLDYVTLAIPLGLHLQEAALKKPRGPGSVMSAVSMSSKASKASKASRMSRASKASKASKASRASARKK